MQNQISSRDAEKSHNFLAPRRPSEIHLYGKLSGIKKACEELNRNHERSMPRRSETHAIAEPAGRRVKEGTSSVLDHSGLHETGGQKPWSGTAISEMCKTYWQTAKRLMNDVSIHHLMDRLFRLEQK